MNLDNIIVVLLRPQDIRNIGAVVRAMKNMGARQLRLVEPASFAPADILGIAHRSDDILADVQIFADLHAALADCRFVLGTSEHLHAERPLHTDPRPLAPYLLTRAAYGNVALLFGPEDNGLDLRDLDHCHAILRLPSDPAYPSLNLAQAVLLLLYELRQAAMAPLPTPPAAPKATFSELETGFSALEAALHDIGFIKPGTATAIMRRLRNIILRAEPSSREINLITAIAREVRKSRGKR